MGESTMEQAYAVNEEKWEELTFDSYRDPWR